jgi:hypothetical protein
LRNQQQNKFVQNVDKLMYFVTRIEFDPLVTIFQLCLRCDRADSSGGGGFSYSGSALVTMLLVLETVGCRCGFTIKQCHDFKFKCLYREKPITLTARSRTLGSWVRNSLETWMSVCVYSVFAVLCAVAALRRADLPSK